LSPISLATQPHRADDVLDPAELAAAQQDPCIVSSSLQPHLPLEAEVRSGDGVKLASTMDPQWSWDPR